MHKKESRGKNPGGKKTQNRGRETERNRTRENFGPSTSSTSCFYHHCLRLGRRRSDRELKKATNGRKRKKPRAEPRGQGLARTKTERGRKNRETEREAIHKDEYWLCHCLRPCKQQKPRIKTNSQQAGLFIIFSVSKAAEQTKGARRQVNIEGR